MESEVTLTTVFKSTGFFSADASVVHRNLEMPEVPVYAVKAHKEIVNSIDAVGGLGIGDGAPEIVTGSRDGKSIKKSLGICSLQVNAF